jgi:hypothetical protein
MSSILAMILAVGMSVPGDVPKEVSEEVEAPRFDARGRWEGTFLFAGGIKWNTEIADGKIRMYENGRIIAIHDWKVVDEGEGKLRLNGNPNKSGWGIYKLEGDRVTIAFCDMPNPRPKEFRVDKNQAMLILHRVKPSK